MKNKEFESKVRIPWELLETYSKNEDCPMSKVAKYIKYSLDLDDKFRVDVTKLVINVRSESKLSIIVDNYLSKSNKSKKERKNLLEWYKLLYFPAIDIKDEMNLEGEYIYLKKGYYDERI